MSFIFENYSWKSNTSFNLLNLIFNYMRIWKKLTYLPTFKRLCFVLQMKSTQICVFYMDFVIVIHRDLRKSSICVTHIVKRLTVLYLPHFIKGFEINSIRCAKEATSALHHRWNAYTRPSGGRSKCEFTKTCERRRNFANLWILCTKTSVIYTISHWCNDYFVKKSITFSCWLLERYIEEHH